MAPTATVQKNVRMEASLQKRGDAAFKELGFGSSEAVRLLWTFVADHHRLPEELDAQLGRGEGHVDQRQRLAEDGAGLAWRLAGIDAGAANEAIASLEDGDGEGREPWDLRSLAYDERALEFEETFDVR